MKRFDLVYADPAWSYDKKVGQGVADEQYKTMSLEELKCLPIKELSKDNSVLLLWATFPMLKEALELVECWGFMYKTAGFVWTKLNKSGTPFFGIGHYTKSNAEVCLLCVRGKGLKVMSNRVSSVVLSVRGKHSSKPHDIYSRIEELYGGGD